MASRTLCQYIGVATVGYLLTKSFSTLFLFVRPSKLGRYRRQGTRTWALVTGASDGIGRGFAEELCARGFNVILHGRNAAKLAGVQESLKKEYANTEIRTLVADVVSFDMSTCTKLIEPLVDLHITVLINNVGGVTPVTGVDREFYPFGSFSGSQIDGLIDLNHRFTTHITNAMLPSLRRNSPGLIMNISSAAEMGFPWLTIYSGTKGYIHAFTRALNIEMKAEKTGVEVLSITVGAVQAANNKSGSGLFCPPARVMAAAALDRVGCGVASVTAYWPHALQKWFMDSLPESWLDALASGVLRGRAEETKKNM